MMPESPSAVRLYPLDHPALAVNAHRKIQQERDEQILILGIGAVKSFDEYKYRCGIIEGLRLALVLIEQSEKDLTQR
jgi:hypothetical protein